jgi:hypothetical protein
MTPPFSNQPEDTANMVAQMYAQRQRHSVAAINSTNGCSTMGSPLPLLISAPMIGVSNVTVEATILLGAIRTDERPPVAEFLLRLCATSIRDESYIGCIYERFDSNCADGNFARARSLFWADTMGYLLWQLPRAIKWAAVLGTIKSLLGG